MIAAFRGHLVRVGLPVGLMIGIGAAFDGPRTAWWDLLVTAGVSAILVTVALTLAVEAFVGVVRRSTLAAAVLLLISVVVTIAAGSAVLYAASALPHGRWERLPDPPGLAERFTGPTCYPLGVADEEHVSIVTASGATFSYPVDDAVRRQWVAAPAAPVNATASAFYCRRRSSAEMTPYKRGGVLARYRIEERGADCGGSHHFLITADHAVWSWSTGSCALVAVVGYLLFLSVGIVIGINDGVRRLSSRAARPWLPGQLAAAQSSQASLLLFHPVQRSSHS